MRVGCIKIVVVHSSLSKEEANLAKKTNNLGLRKQNVQVYTTLGGPYESDPHHWQLALECGRAFWELEDIY